MAKKKGLGKGLDALLGGASSAPSSPESGQPIPMEPAGARVGARFAAGDQTDTAASLNTNGVLRELPLEQCQRGRYQPRQEIDSASLEDLTASIRAQGIMQPIVVRPLTETGQEKYEIIAGERRWRAAQQAGLERIPAIVRMISDEAAIAMALIENLQREDLNPMEEAQAMYRLQQEFELTHQEVADALGKSRAAVSNALRLLNLQMEVRLMLEHGDLEMGHARALLTLEGVAQVDLAREVVDKGLSVRQTEALARRAVEGGPSKPAAVKPQDANIRQLQNDLAEKLGVPVTVQHQPNGSGKLVLKYNSLDELDGILNHIK